MAGPEHNEGTHRGSPGRKAVADRGCPDCRPQRHREQWLLSRLGNTRDRDDAGGLRRLIAQLLYPYRQTIARRVAWLLGARAGRQEDREDVVGDVNERLTRLLSRQGGIGDVPLGVAVRRSIDWAVADFLRRRARHEASEVLTDPAHMPEAWHQEITRVEQVQGLAGALAPLTRREREIVFERAIIGFNGQEVADRHGISRGAADTAYSRALAKLRREMGGDGGS